MSVENILDICTFTQYFFTEKLQSSKEKLQSSKEKLQSSKEKLQSGKEKLNLNVFIVLLPYLQGPALLFLKMC